MILALAFFDESVYRFFNQKDLPVIRSSAKSFTGQKIKKTGRLSETGFLCFTPKAPLPDKPKNDPREFIATK